MVAPKSAEMTAWFVNSAVPWQSVVTCMQMAASVISGKNFINNSVTEKITPCWILSAATTALATINNKWVDLFGGQTENLTFSSSCWGVAGHFTVACPFSLGGQPKMGHKQSQRKKSVKKICPGLISICSQLGVFLLCWSTSGWQQQTQD